MTTTTSFSRLRVLSPLLLIALLGLPTILAADSNVRIVQVSYVGGDVLVTQGSSTQAVRVKNYLPLAHGALVETRDGVVEIEFEDELLARLAEDSRLDLSELVLRDDGSRLTRLTLREGTATFSAKLKKYDTFQIITPYFSVTVLKNAKVRIDLTDQGGRVKVLDGKVEVETPDDVLELKEGRQLEWDAASSQVALGPASEADGWDEWNDDRDEAVQNARRARRWGVRVASSPYYSNYHYGHSHRYGYCPYYSYGPLLSVHFGHHLSYFSFWGIGFGYHSYGHYYPGFYSGYYPVFAGGYWPYSYGVRRHHRHYSRRSRHRRDRYDGSGGTVASSGGGSTFGDDGDRVGTRRRRRGEGDRTRDRFRREGTRVRNRNTDRQRRTNSDRTSRSREEILRRLAERGRTRGSSSTEKESDRRTRVTDRQRPADTGQNGDRRRETVRRLAERGYPRRASSGDTGTATTRRSDRATATDGNTRRPTTDARRSSPRREAPRQATRRRSQPERSTARTRPTTRQERPSARTRSRSSRPASSASRRSPSNAFSSSRPRSSGRTASAGRSRSSTRASRPSRSASPSRSFRSGGSVRASRGKRNR